MLLRVRRGWYGGFVFSHLGSRQSSQACAEWLNGHHGSEAYVGEQESWGAGSWGGPSQRFTETEG